MNKILKGLLFAFSIFLVVGGILSLIGLVPLLVAAPNATAITTLIKIGIAEAVVQIIAGAVLLDYLESKSGK